MGTNGKTILDVVGSTVGNELIESQARVIGLVVALMVAIGGRFDARIAEVFELVTVAHRHGRVKIYFNSLGEPVGYVIWGTLSEDVEDRLISEGLPSLHLSEWNEGGAMWILDAHFRSGYLGGIGRTHMLPLVPPDTTIKYFRRTQRGLIIKEIGYEGIHRMFRRL